MRIRPDIYVRLVSGFLSLYKHNLVQRKHFQNKNLVSFHFTFMFPIWPWYWYLKVAHQLASCNYIHAYIYTHTRHPTDILNTSNTFIAQKVNQIKSTEKNKRRTNMLPKMLFVMFACYGQFSALVNKTKYIWRLCCVHRQ